MIPLPVTIKITFRPSSFAATTKCRLRREVMKKPIFALVIVAAVTLTLADTNKKEIIAITRTYLEPSDVESDNPWQTRTLPCPFLKDNLCSIYEGRPADCSGYPYLYDPEFICRTWGMLDLTYTCPIVYTAIEELKKSLGFLRSRRAR